MLRWSARETGRSVDIRAMVDPAVDPGITAGRELVALGEATVVTRRPDRMALDAVAAVVGLPAAIDAAAVAANFQIMNRVVDATGLAIGRRAQDLQQDVIDALGMRSFPHAGH